MPVRRVRVLQESVEFTTPVITPTPEPGDGVRVTTEPVGEKAPVPFSNCTPPGQGFLEALQEKVNPPPAWDTMSMYASAVWRSCPPSPRAAPRLLCSHMLDVMFVQEVAAAGLGEGLGTGGGRVCVGAGGLGPQRGGEGDSTHAVKAGQSALVSHSRAPGEG